MGNGKATKPKHCTRSRPELQTTTINPSSSVARGRLCTVADSRSAVLLSGFAVGAECFRTVPDITEQSRHPGRGSSLLHGLCRLGFHY